MSVLSTTANSCAFSARSSASRRIKRARSVPVIVPQGPSSKAARAALTARSTSSSPASGAVAHARPVYGLMLSKVFPESASTHSPPISILYRASRRTRGLRSTVSPLSFLLWNLHPRNIIYEAW